MRLSGENVVIKDEYEFRQPFNTTSRRNKRNTAM